MARKARVEFPGACYHLLDRGDRGEAIFCDDVDRTRFLATLGQVCARTGWRVHAFVLMTNHYHLLVKTPHANLVAGMRWFQGTWTARFNRRHRLSGHLLQGRYKSVVVDPEERGYLVTLSDYIHLNPVRAGLVRLDGRLFDYGWSSYPCYAARSGRPAWFEPGQVLGELGLEDSAAGRRSYAERMRQRATEEAQPEREREREALRQGWCLGGASFRERMLDLIEQTSEKFSQRKAIDGVVRRSHDGAEAERLLQAGLQHFGLDAEQVLQLKKNDPRKLLLARQLRTRTTVTNKWIANALGMGHPTAVSRSLGSDRPEGGLETSLRAALDR